MTLGTFNVGLRGFFKYESVNPDSGRRTLLLDWHENAILDTGRNIMATSSGWAGSGSKCQVGTDSTAANASQTQLLGYVFGTALQFERTWGAQSSAPYYSWDRTTYRFNIGEAGGNNINEAGIGWNISAGPYLISRSRTVDGNGDPVTVTPLIDEYLDVTYELRYYPPLVDSIGTISLDGVVYDTVTRAANVTSWGYPIGPYGAGRAFGKYSISTADWRVFAGVYNAGLDPATGMVIGYLGAITGEPSGLVANCDNITQFNEAYSNNSYQIAFGSNCGLTGWNVSGGRFRAIRFKTTIGDFQTSFTAQGSGLGVPKTSAYQMQLIWTLGWTAAVIP